MLGNSKPAHSVARSQSKGKPRESKSIISKKSVEKNSRLDSFFSNKEGQSQVSNFLCGPGTSNFSTFSNNSAINAQGDSLKNQQPTNYTNIDLKGDYSF
jgi:hypothetical protein